MYIRRFDHGSHELGSKLLFQGSLPAPPNYPLRDPKYDLIDHIRPLIEVHWGVLVQSFVGILSKRATRLCIGRFLKRVMLEALCSSQLSLVWSPSSGLGCWVEPLYASKTKGQLKRSPGVLFLGFLLILVLRILIVGKR